MATTVFTTWAALRTAIKNAIANHVAGQACIGEYTLGDTHFRHRTYDELIGLLQKTYEIEAIESAGDPSTLVSYGRHRRFD